MRMLLLVIFGLMIASVLAILVIKPFTSSDGRDSGAVKNGPIEQPEPKP
ncbi:MULTISPECIES: hypothetical protein [Rhizobium]|uniref:Type III secretory pathway component EscT n=1 Tax=Rhizobium tropici TaxID=398 RepID=A0ABR6QZB6_RHITR|nr:MULTISPECIES: hypothetical protein [Rhizobium]AGB75580.1 hypothetical protein RTCIAT899_PC08965 [Rhizobium tropici CIAT 899]MBB4241954.1 type III secretory pathway component EscT [Rhizobium tropici]MBB5593400.1 type III secretory pathway component EscT [Rhizobium tropici]MBB6492279.1 type III secretory pathway component EscT [Rhizobium tropici]